MKKRMLISWVALWMLLVSTWAQGLLVTGIVKDKETRQALANVNVSVQGSNVGTVTNADGVFSLKVSQEVENSIGNVFVLDVRELNEK